MRKLNRSTILVLACLNLPVFAWATVLQPWYPEKMAELQARADYSFESFNEVESSGGNFHYKARNSFLDLSLLGSIEGYGVELEAVISDTKKHSFYPDCFKLTGRYLLLNDSVGDYLSVIAGLTVIIPTKVGLDDIGSFHHGYFESEAHLAVGRETVCGDWWTSRWWAVGAVGCATSEGSPWFRANASYETNWDRTIFLRAFVNTLWGLGRDAVHRHPFRGYGSVAHRSVDVGTHVSYQTDCDLLLTAGYSFRLYAHNFPKNVNVFTFNVLYPFAL